MKEITEKNLHSLTFDGIIVGVPKNTVEGQHSDISFIFECAYRSKGKHGYPEEGYNPDDSSFYSAAYNSKYLPNGLFFNSTSRFILEDSFRFDSYRYYKFLHMEEFCMWYLQQKNYEIWAEGGDLKGKIHTVESAKDEIDELLNMDKELIYREIYDDPNCDDHMKRLIIGAYPSFAKSSEEVKERPVKRKEKLKEVIKYVHYLNHIQFYEGMAEKAVEPSTRETYRQREMQLREEFLNWLEEEV